MNVDLTCPQCGYNLKGEVLDSVVKRMEDENMEFSHMTHTNPKGEDEHYVWFTPIDGVKVPVIVAPKLL